jgi:hypothetical protein
MADTAAAVAELKKACDAAYAANQTSCSNAVWDVIKAVHDPKQEYRQANALVDWMTITWSTVTLDDGFLAANQGAVVVGGKKETTNGHVILIYPGAKILNGGYQYYWAAGKKTMTMPRKDSYPPCLSTSMGAWPGAKSSGDKTVWDPWANDAKFELVSFFTPKWPLPAD